MTKVMLEKGWVQEKEDHDQAVMEMEPEVPFLTSCPSLWEKTFPATFRAIFGVLDQGWYTQAYREGRRLLPNMEIATCVGRKRKQEKRIKAKRRLCKTWTSCYHQEEPKTPSRKRISYAWICCSSSCFRIKEMGKGKDNYFFEGKHYMIKKTKATLPHFHCLHFFTFSHSYFGPIHLFHQISFLKYVERPSKKLGPILRGFPFIPLPDSLLVVFSIHSFSIIFLFPEKTTISSQHKATARGNSEDHCRSGMGTQLSQSTDVLPSS